MSDKTGIQWTEATWNPFVGCSITSPGCTNCYAMTEAYRQIRCAKGSGRETHYKDTVRLVKGIPVWTGLVKLSPPHIIDKPLHWKKPRRIFVNSMSDMHHETVSFDDIDKVVRVMARCPQHTFQILTKRAAGMNAYWSDPELPERIGFEMPLPNVWLGVSTERQKEADERIPLLLATPAAVRFISAEPLLEQIDLTEQFILWDDAPNLDWVIVGGESGSGARAMAIEWVAKIIADCKFWQVACFVKQFGDHATMEGKPFPTKAGGGDPITWPEPFRVQNFPLPS